MDWLSDEHLVSTYHSVNENVKRLETKGANSLPFDYEDALSRMLTTLHTNLERIAYKKMTKTAKSNDESSKLRAMGNKLFTSSEPNAFDMALVFYNKSIAYALPNSEEMALSYANRSAILFKMNCPQECLDNIERALSNYPHHLKSKLYDRQAECYSQLAVDCKTEAKVWLNKVPAKDSNRAALVEILKDCPKKKLQNFVVYKDCVIPEIKNPSKRYSCASDAVEVGYSKKFGRHVIATRDIDVGEILIVERPYIQTPAESNVSTHCSYCLAYLWSLVPCDECVNSVYCSEDCKEKAWIEYHYMECTIADLMRHYDWSSVQMKSIRLLLQMYQEAGSFQELKKRVLNILGNTLDACGMKVQDEWYQGTTLESVLCLYSHEGKLTRENFEKVTVCTLQIMFYLLTNTEFFGVKFDRNESYDVDMINFMSQNPDFIFVGRLFIKLSGLSYHNNYKSHELTKEGRKELGIGTPRLISLLNNSCYPNVFVMGAKDQLVTRAAHPIKKGEQIFMCYCGSYNFLNDKADRYKFFKSFFFTCNCIACTEDWRPLMNNDDKIKLGLKVERIWQRCRTSSNKDLCKVASNVFNLGRYRDLDELLIIFHEVIRAIYQEVGVNSMEMRLIIPELHEAYSLAGNVRKYQNISLASLASN